MFKTKKDLQVANDKILNLQQEIIELNDKLQKKEREVQRLSTEAEKHYEELSDLKQKYAQSQVDLTDTLSQLDEAKKVAKSGKDYTDSDLSDINLKDLFGGNPEEFNPSNN